MVLIRHARPAGRGDSARTTDHPAPTAIPVAPNGGSSTATPTATPAPSASGTGDATAVNPCDLVPSQEASQLTHVTYGSGKLEIDSPISRRCIYGAQTKHVFEVIFVQGSSPAQATAFANQLRAQAEQTIGGSVSMATLQGVGDDAEKLTASKNGLDIAGLYVRVGSAGFALVDEALGGAATIASLTDEAQVVIGRLP